MPLVEFGKNNQISLWKHIPDNDGWEGYSYICPKCDFEVLQNEEVAPFYKYCPMCGKKMFVDEEKEDIRKAKKREYMRNYQQKRRANMKGGKEE